MSDRPYWSVYFRQGESLDEEFDQFFRALHGADYTRNRVILDALEFWLEVNRIAEDSQFDPPREYDERMRWFMATTRQALRDLERAEFSDGPTDDT